MRIRSDMSAEMLILYKTFCSDISTLLIHNQKINEKYTTVEIIRNISEVITIYYQRKTRNILKLSVNYGTSYDEYNNEPFVIFGEDLLLCDAIQNLTSVSKLREQLRIERELSNAEHLLNTLKYPSLSSNTSRN